MEIAAGVLIGLLIAAVLLIWFLVWYWNGIASWSQELELSEGQYPTAGMEGGGRTLTGWLYAFWLFWAEVGFWRAIPLTNKARRAIRTWERPQDPTVRRVLGRIVMKVEAEDAKMIEEMRTPDDPEEQTLEQKMYLDAYAYVMKRKAWLFPSGRSDLFDQRMSSGSPAASKARGPNSVQPPSMVVLKIKDIEEERRVPGVKVEKDQSRNQLRILNESGEVVGEYPLDKVEYWSVEAES